VANCEQTSETIVQLAARYAHHPDPSVRRMAMSLLTQYPDHANRQTPAPPRLPVGSLGYIGNTSAAPLRRNALLGDDYRGTILDDAPPITLAELLQRG
jgi:hypothetical protein